MKMIKNFNKLIKLEKKLTEEQIKKMGDIEYISFIPKAHHTIVYGSAGSFKTTTVTYELIREMECDKELEVYLLSFDASNQHNKAMFLHAKSKGVINRFHILHETTPDDFAEACSEIEGRGDLSNVVVVIDTFKKLNIGDTKKAYASAFTLIKKLTKGESRATVISIAHTNKYGGVFAGFAEMEQDVDGMLFFQYVKVGGHSVVSVQAEERLRFDFEPISFFSPNPRGGGYQAIMNNYMRLSSHYEMVTLSDGSQSFIKRPQGQWDINVMKVADALVRSPSGLIATKNLEEKTGLSGVKLIRALQKGKDLEWIASDIGIRRGFKLTTPRLLDLIADGDTFEQLCDKVVKDGSVIKGLSERLEKLKKEGLITFDDVIRKVDAGKDYDEDIIVFTPFEPEVTDEIVRAVDQGQDTLAKMSKFLKIDKETLSLALRGEHNGKLWNFKLNKCELLK